MYNIYVKYKKLIAETDNTNEPKNKKLKVKHSSTVKNLLIYHLFLQDQNLKHLELNARSSSNFNDHHLFFVVRDGLQKCPYQSECKHSPDLTIYLT
ncbi:unnamed protein product [Rotaria sp. Silwood2]|nr:unnamed protein product [Rotaria sp. Silwood2]CAF3155134.1 unnamed protein product [Rotaria sp. Silwood2]CAF3478876.1 unnamed protein product [Rotaria sp. Silwood2]CAF4322267.1 unnamed protein product [Rotaria sp. Silwood2]